MRYAGKTLVWLPERGIGFYPVEGANYDDLYFGKYLAYSYSELGKQLKYARLSLIGKYPCGEIVDIGIGCGDFLTAIKIRGYDIEGSYSKKWLIENGLYHNAENEPVDTMTFWDSLEHIRDPRHILKNIKKYAFISVPIFRDLTHVLRSKHYRPNEHYWYWTAEGLRIFMATEGFDEIEHNTMESDLGREDIHTFVFKKTEILV
jgi:hypothetical protein